MTREEYLKEYGVEPFSNTTLPKEMTTPPKNIFEKTGEFFGISNIAKHEAAQITRLSGILPGQAGEAGRQFNQLYEQDREATGAPSDREVLGSAINLGTLLAPGGFAKSSIPKKVLMGATTGYGLDVGTNLQNKEKPLTEAFKPGVGTVVSGLLPLIGPIFGNLSPKKLEEINLRITPGEKQAMAKQGKDIADFLSKKKVVGTPEVRYQKVSQIYDNLENQIGQLVKEAKVKFSKNDVLKEISKVPDQFGDDIVGYDEAVKATQKVMKFIQSKAPKIIDGELLNTYKRNIYKRAYSRNNTDVVNEAFHSVGSMFKDILDKNVPGLNAINKEYGNVILARKILFKAMSRAQIGLTGKILGTAVGAGVGGAAGGGIGAGVGAVVGEKFAEKAVGTATRSAVGSGIQTLIEKIPVDKMGNMQISKKALIRLLQELFGQ